MATATDNKDTIEKFMKVFSTGDVDGIVDFFTPDMTWWVAGSLEGFSGTNDTEGMRRILSGLGGLTTTGAIELTPVEYIAEGDRVAVEAKSHGELTDGRFYENQYHFVFTVRDGKIAAVREYNDTDLVRATFIA